MHGHIPKPAPTKLGSPMTAEEKQAAQSLKEAVEVTSYEISPGLWTFPEAMPEAQPSQCLRFIWANDWPAGEYRMVTISAPDYSNVDALAGQFIASE